MRQTQNCVCVHVHEHLTSWLHRIGRPEPPCEVRAGPELRPQTDGSHPESPPSAVDLRGSTTGEVDALLALHLIAVGHGTGRLLGSA